MHPLIFYYISKRKKSYTGTEVLGYFKDPFLKIE